MSTTSDEKSFGGFSNTAQSSPFGEPAAFGKPLSFGPTPAPNVFDINNQTLYFKPKPATATTGGLFGEPATTFAQGSKAPGFVFGETKNAFGSPGNAIFLGNKPTTGTAVVKFSPLLSTDTMMRNNITTNIQTRLQCIMCMKEYEGKSFEELRLEDYQAGLKKQISSNSSTVILQPARFGCGVSFNNWNAPTGQQPTLFGPNNNNNNNSLPKFSYNPLSILQTGQGSGIPFFGYPKKPLDNVENLTSWCVTNTFVKKDIFKWTIDNFRYRTEARGESIKSSIFTSGQGSECEHNWRFDIYPNGYNDSSMDFVGLKINLLDDKHPDNIQVTMKMSILNSFDYPVHTVGENAITITIPETGIIYCPNFLNKQEFINNCSSFLPYDSLKILFEIGTMTGTLTKSKKITQAYSPKDQLRDQIFKYFNSEKLSDVVIEVDGSEIKAHKLMLSTQSPIFSAMFDEESTSEEEKNKNRIKIDDMKLDVAKQLLEFIYTNKKPTRINDFTTELMIAAQKYQITGLRIMCEEILFDSISIDNAINTLLFAHKHDINKLKDFVIEFIQTHGSILRSNEFKDLEKERPALAMEVYRAIATEKTVD